MLIFSERILKLLNDYKRILKRYLTTTEREKTIINLGLKRKSLKFDNEVILFNKAHRVIQDIEYWTQKYNKAAAEYSGINEYYQHLKNYLSHYRIEHNKLVHITRKVSCALVHAIQLVSSSVSTFSEKELSKLEECLHTVTKFGTHDQKTMLAKILHKHKDLKKYSLTATLENFLITNN